MLGLGIELGLGEGLKLGLALVYSHLRSKMTVPSCGVGFNRSLSNGPAH